MPPDIHLLCSLGLRPRLTSSRQRYVNRYYTRTAIARQIALRYPKQTQQFSQYNALASVTIVSSA